MIHNEKELKKWIDQQNWVRAKTYEKIAPHEYLVKSTIPIKDRIVFIELARFIKRNGFKERYYKTVYIYFVFGNKKYWTMGSEYAPNQIINRAKKELIYH